MIFKIGEIEVKTKVFFAPMCGISDLPFRKMINKFCSKIVTFSEMIASDAAIYEKEKTLKRAKHSLAFKDDSLENIYGVQIAGYCPEKVSRAIEIAIETSGAKIIDLNFGCPVKKIVNNYSGSALMKDLGKMKEIIKAAFSTCQRYDLKNCG